ncbi:MAG: ATP-binding protein [Bacteroidota bacterium]
MRETVLNILCLEDNPDDAELVRYRLKKEGYKMQFVIVSTKKEYLDKINAVTFDLILCDYNLPGYSGMTALQHARQICPDVPFICVSGTIGEYLAVELLKQGASDYVMKDQLDKLPFAVRRALKEVQEQTARHNAENELRKLSQAVQQSPVSIIITNEHGEIEYVNPKTTELTGYSSEELIGKKPRIFSSGEKPEEDYQNLWKTVSSGSEWRGEFHNKKKNGELYWEAASISPILDHEGKITNYLAVKENITERKEFIIELVKAKAKAESGDRLKTAFMNNISHEIRTPLNHILGFGQMVIEPNLSQEEKKECFEILNAGCDRLMNTINDYMDISLITSGNMEVHKRLFALRNLLEEIYDKFLKIAQTNRLALSIQTQTAENILQINSDQDLLRKALRHLLNNAIKFTKEGSVSFGFERKGSELEFFVIDTGVGINTDVQAHIFDKFTQENASNTRGYEGSGLGLSIVRGIVELLGGRIWLKSAKGEGSSFFFSIPVETADAGK